MAWPDSHDVLGDADQTIYYDPDHGGTSSGTSANPYKTMAECIAALTYTDFVTNTWKATIKCRSGTEVVTTAIDTAVTCDATYYLVIEPDTGHEPTGTQPLIAITTTANLTTMFSVDAYVVLDGIHFKNGYVSASRTAVSCGGFCAVRNCMFEGDYATNAVGIGLKATFSNDDGSFVENCFFYDCDAGFYFNDRRADPDIRNCTFANNNAAISSPALTGLASTKSAITGCLFYNNTDDGDETYVATYFASGSYNATTLATAKSWTGVTSWITSVSTTAGVDIVNAATPDFRAVASGALDDGDQSGSAPATDMFGTSRPQGTFDDIGYYEIVASGTTGTGTPAAQSAVVAGVGERTIDGTGTPASPAAIVAGVGFRQLSGSGVLAAQVSASSGAGVIISTVEIQLTAANNRELKDSGGSLVASLSGVIWEWYDDPDSTAGEPTDTGTFNTSVAGEVTFNVENSQLANGQFGQLILYHPTINTFRAVLRVPVVA